MTKSKKYPYSDITFNTRRNKWREVRDVVNRIRPRYKSEWVDDFMRRNYFLQPKAVEWILTNCDSEPLETKSITYLTVMRDDFNLFDHIIIPQPGQLTINPTA
jgi:hypothetical protein